MRDLDFFKKDERHFQMNYIRTAKGNYEKVPKAMGFPGGSVVKNLPVNAGEDSLEKEWQPTPVLLPGKPHE